MPSFPLRLRYALPLLALLVAACDTAGTDDDDDDPGRDDNFDGVCAGPNEVSVDPTGTYLRVHSTDNAAGPTIVVLADVGVQPGASIKLGRRGDFQIDGDDDPTRTRNEMIGVFSSSNEVLAWDQPARVPGALDAGEDFVTLRTRVGGLPTDIPEDFAIGASTIVTVPAGAAYLMVSPHDSEFWNNLDEDQDFRLCIGG